jgi:hypothetical protein
MDVDEAAGLVHYEVDFNKSYSRWMSSGLRPFNKKGIQLLARYSSDSDSRKPSLFNIEKKRVKILVMKQYGYIGIGNCGYIFFRKNNLYKKENRQPHIQYPFINKIL